jgi:hypothetical protein
MVADTLHITGLSAGQASVVGTTCLIPKIPTTSFMAFNPTNPAPSEKRLQKLAELEAKKRELLRELSRESNGH